MMDDLISRAAAIDALWKSDTLTKENFKACRVIEGLHAVDAVQVVFCKDCEFCNPIYCNQVGEAVYDGSFECGDTEIQYYAPDYHMDTYYCADGKRRDEHCT